MMQWSDQTIEEAVETAKRRNAIFVVFVDDDTRRSPLHDIIESDDVSNLLMDERFVAIRIQSSDPSYSHFVSIYQLVPVPSLFFINHTGWPVEIVSARLSHSEVVERITRVLGRAGQSSNSPPNEPQDLSSEQSSSSTHITSSTSSSSTATTVIPVTVISAVPKKRDDSKNINKTSSDVEASTSSGSVIDSDSSRHDISKLPSLDDIAPSRISNLSSPPSEPIGGPGVTGRSMNIRRIPNAAQQDSPITGFLASIRRWMETILQAGRGATGPRTGRLLNEGRGSSAPLSMSGAQSHSQIYEPSSQLSRDPGYAHIQFRLPDGSTHSSSFPIETTIREVRDYVQHNIALPFRDFRLSTSYPRIEFTDYQTDATVAELGLVPRSVILIIPVTETARPVLSSASDLLWVVITWPFSALFSIVQHVNLLLFGEPQTEITDQNVSQQSRASQEPARNRNATDGSQSNIRRRVPSSSVVQREGNVYRLSNRQDDSEDENNTWNGNSTQQM